MTDHSAEYMGIEIGDRCEVFRTFEPDNPLFCRVLGISNEWIIADRRSVDGEQFGLTLFRLDSIWKLRFETNRIRRIFEQDSKLKFPKVPEGALSSTLFHEIEALYGALTLYCESLELDVVSIGSVTEVRGDIVVINEYRPLASPERNRCVLLIHEITRLEAGGDYERRLLESYGTPS